MDKFMDDFMDVRKTEVTEPSLIPMVSLAANTPGTKE